MPISILAQATSDNAPGGAVLTFAFPIILFAVIAVVLYYLLFARPHPRVPSRRVVMATASGGGSAESSTEPHGARGDTLADAADGTDETEGTEASE